MKGNFLSWLKIKRRIVVWVKKRAEWNKETDRSVLIGDRNNQEHERKILAQS